MQKNNKMNKQDKIKNKEKNLFEDKFNNLDIKTEKYKSQLFKLLLPLIFLLTIFDSTYAFFNYKKDGLVNEFRVGKIYLNYTTSHTMSLSRAVPRNKLDPNVYIGFTIKGLNEYKEKDIVYAIDLLYGDVPVGKTEENRIRDEFLRFTLTKSINNSNPEIVVDNMNYNDIQNLRLYVDRILKDTAVETVHDYKLYVWITDEININNSLNNDYTLEEWNNLFASIKVKLIGDFEEKGTNNSIKVNFDANEGNVNVPYKYYDIGDIYGSLPIPVREDYEFDGWHYGNKKILSTDVVQDNKTSFISNDDIVLDGTNYVDTEMNIFSESNWQRNFLLSFKIKEKDVLQTSQATLINAKLEVEDRGYPGFLFRKYSGNNFFEISANSDETTIGKRISNIPYDALKITIIRINNKLYYNINDGDFALVYDYTGFKNYFDVPLTIGASLSEDNTPQRFFKGVVSDFTAQYLDDEATLENYQNHIDYSSNKEITLKAAWKKIGEKYSGEYIFDGTNYINTNIYLFNKDNWQRDFYMSFEIIENNSTDTMATPMSAKNENASPWPGFELRLNGNLNTYRSKASKKIGIANDITNIPVKTTRKVQYLRINNVLYYNIDSTTGGKFVEMLDFSDFNLWFDVPVTFGASLTKPGGIPQRFFIGKLANMQVKFIRSDELAVYESMLSN